MTKWDGGRLRKLFAGAAGCGRTSGAARAGVQSAASSADPEAGKAFFDVIAFALGTADILFFTQGDQGLEFPAALLAYKFIKRHNKNIIHQSDREKKSSENGSGDMILWSCLWI